MTALPFLTSSPISAPASPSWGGAGERRGHMTTFASSTDLRSDNVATSLYDLNDYYSPPCAPPPSPLMSLSQEPTIDDSPFWEVGALSFSQAYEDADNYDTDGMTSWVESSTVEVINQLRSLKIDFDSYRAASPPTAGGMSSPSSFCSPSTPSFFSISPHRP